MIHFLLSSWLSSLTFLWPRQFLQEALAVGRHLLQGILGFLKHFWWLVAADIFLAAITGPVLHQSFSASLKATHPPLIITMIAAVLGALSYGITMLLFICITRTHLLKDINLSLPREMLRYLQLSLLFVVFYFSVIMMLISLGITIFPPMHISIKITKLIIETMLFVSWISNEQATLGQFMHILEKTINSFFYNLPGFIFLGTFFWISSLGLNYVLCPEITLSTLFAHPLALLSEKQLPLSTGFFVIFRLANLVLYALFVAIIKKWYQSKSDQSYAHYYFTL